VLIAGGRITTAPTGISETAGRFVVTGAKRAAQGVATTVGLAIGMQMVCPTCSWFGSTPGFALCRLATEIPYRAAMAKNVSPGCTV
jgi:hypothetical protein